MRKAAKLVIYFLLPLFLADCADATKEQKKTAKKTRDIPFVKRNAQTIINTAFIGIDPYNLYDSEEASTFWADQVKSLEKKALEPVIAFVEMRDHTTCIMEACKT